MDFSEVLKELRESNCITQEQLARQIDVSRSTIAGYESKNREPDFDKLLSLSRFFHVSVDYLLTGKLPENRCIYMDLSIKIAENL